MTIKKHHPNPIIALAVLAALMAGSKTAFASFTGPTGAYYLDNANNSTIYVVQGGAVINSFAISYATAGGANHQESSLVVTNVVTTTGFGSGYVGTTTGAANIPWAAWRPV